MTQPTYKQVNYANRLGIKNPQNYTKEELIQMIDEKVKPKRDYDAEVKQAEEASYNEGAQTIKPQEFGKLPHAYEVVEKQRKSVKDTRYEKDPVGLAVEVFGAMMGLYIKAEKPIDMNRLMDVATDLVKQAQKAFS